MAYGEDWRAGVKITLIVEGSTERAFLPYLRNYLRPRLPGPMPVLDAHPYNGRIPTGDNLKRDVALLLSGKNASDHVIALTDVYTGSNPPAFLNAADAKSKMRQWVGDEPRFHPHAAQFEFEAWLIPYWNRIQAIAGHNQAAPSGNPEQINHNNPPSNRIKTVFLNGSRGKRYKKTIDPGRILKDMDLSIAADRCPELKALLNSILDICGGRLVP